MAIHPRAGQPASPDLLIDVAQLERAPTTSSTA